MKIDEIYSMEQDNTNAIHLVRDRLFWQAWEHSAFYFIKMFRPYKVHSRFVQKISAEQVWLGFPKSNLDQFEKESIDSGLSWNVIDENRIDITGFSIQEGFEIWKNEILSHSQKNTKKVEFQENSLKSCETKVFCVCSDEKSLLQMYRIVYDLSLYLCNVITKVAKGYRFGLADKLKENSFELVENLHLAVNNFSNIEKKKILELVSRMRIKVRLLQDLKQISTKQWLFINKQLEELCNYIGRSS